MCRCISRRFTRIQLQDKPRTPPKTLDQARQIALEVGFGTL